MTTEDPRPIPHEDIAAAVRAEIGRLVPGESLPGATTAAPAPAASRSRCGAPRVAETSSVMNGQYRALEARVDDLRGNYQELRHDMDARFSALSGEIVRQADNTNARLDAVMSAISSKGNGDFTKYAGVIAIIVGIASAVVSGFIKLENDSIGDKITSQGVALADKIAQQGATLTDKIVNNTNTQNANVARLDSAVGELQRTTVPRAELEKTTGANTAGVADVRRTQEHHTEQLASLLSDMTYIKADVERFKTIAVSRSEIDNSRQNFENRLNLISNRIVDLGKELSTVPTILENQRQLRDQVNDFQRKFVAVPAFPKYNDR